MEQLPNECVEMFSILIAHKQYTNYDHTGNQLTPFNDLLTKAFCGPAYPACRRMPRRVIHWSFVIHSFTSNLTSRFIPWNLRSLGFLAVMLVVTLFNHGAAA